MATFEFAAHFFTVENNDDVSKVELNFFFFLLLALNNYNKYFVSCNIQFYPFFEKQQACLICLIITIKLISKAVLNPYGTLCDDLKMQVAICYTPGTISVSG